MLAHADFSARGSRTSKSHRIGIRGVPLKIQSDVNWVTMLCVHAAVAESSDPRDASAIPAAVAIFVMEAKKGKRTCRDFGARKNPKVVVIYP